MERDPRFCHAYHEHTLTNDILSLHAAQVDCEQLRDILEPLKGPGSWEDMSVILCTGKSALTESNSQSRHVQP